MKIDDLVPADRDHLNNWLNMNPGLDWERVITDIELALTDDIEMLETHSWPQIVERGARLRGAQA